MTHFMRKHKTLIFWMLVIFVGFPMLFFGVDFSALFSMMTGRDAMGLKPIAVVHDTPIPADALLSELQQMASQMPNTTTEQLIQSGMAEQALDRLINSVLVQKELENRDLKLTDAFVVERMKKLPAFQTPEGEFDGRAWNRWVSSRRDQNWAALYESLGQDFARDVFLQLASASARVLESEVRDEFARANTTIQVKYAAIDPPIEPTDEQLQATYNEDPDLYAIPGARTVRFVEFSLLHPLPDVARDVLEKARAGEDFAELAKEYSGMNQETGGEIGWISAPSAIGTHRESLFELAVGDVSEPIEGPGGYYIYKVEDERTSEITQERDIFVREIQIAAMLSPDESQQLRDAAQALHDKAEAEGSLEKAAQELGYEVEYSGAFVPSALEIENIPRRDVFTMKRFTERLEPGELADVVSAQRNVYVAEVASVAEPTPRSFEEARDDVLANTIVKIRQSPEHRTRLTQLGSDIQTQAASIDEIPAKFPELNVEIKESQPFSIQDMLFTQGIPLRTQDIYAAVGEKDPGAFAGPLQAFDGSLYFVELSQKTAPDEEAWAQTYPEEKEQIRTRLTMMRENARLQDYVTQLREQSLADIVTNWDVLAQALGMNQTSADAAAAEAATPAS